VNDMLKIQEQLTKDRDELLKEVVILRDKVTELSANEQEFERLKDEADQNMAQVGNGLLSTDDVLCLFSSFVSTCRQ
ncbi:hypothetical protein scyTo_0026252, partial [Scyliorhinus torazame]|nr:hypothetical protein [Scyliorhinus torazame]